MSTTDRDNRVVSDSTEAQESAAGTTPVPAVAALPVTAPDSKTGKKAIPTIVWPIIALLVLLGSNFLFSGGSFLHFHVANGQVYGSLIDVLRRGAPVMLLSLGMTLVIATSGIDLSVGAVMAIIGAIAACLIARPAYSSLSAINIHNSAIAVILICLFVAALLGLWNGSLVAVVGIQPIIATLILMVAGRGLAQLLTNGQNPGFVNAHLSYLGNGVLFWLPAPITIVAVGLIIMTLLTRATALGLFIESVGNNPISSRYAGVNATAVKLVVYTICGVCAGVAGLIAVADVQKADVNNAGLYLELDAILAVAIGGTSLNGGRFSLGGSIIGAILIQTLSTMIETLGNSIKPSDTKMIKAVVVIAVCLLQSEKFRASIRKLAHRGHAT